MGVACRECTCSRVDGRAWFGLPSVVAVVLMLGGGVMASGHAASEASSLVHVWVLVHLWVGNGSVNIGSACTGPFLLFYIAVAHDTRRVARFLGPVTPHHSFRPTMNNSTPAFRNASLDAIVHVASMAGANLGVPQAQGLCLWRTGAWQYVCATAAIVDPSCHFCASCYAREVSVACKLQPVWVFV